MAHVRQRHRQQAQNLLAAHRGSRTGNELLSVWAQPSVNDATIGVHEYSVNLNVLRVR